jgi:hypothetical protein
MKTQVRTINIKNLKQLIFFPMHFPPGLKNIYNHFYEELNCFARISLTPIASIGFDFSHVGIFNIADNC